MIDWQRVALLREEVGEDGFALIVDLFLEEVSAVVAQLPDVVPEGREAACHFLKGGALNLGFSALAALCEEGERRAGLGLPVDAARIAALYGASRARFLAGPHPSDAAPEPERQSPACEEAG